jgi:hypothetical protein
MRHLIASLALAATSVGAAHAASFDARRADDIAAVITSHGASGTLKKDSDDKVYFAGQAGQTFFEAHFQNCDKPRAYCTTMLLAGSWDSKKISVDQINRWNRWTLYCPAYIDGDGSPNLWYTIAVSSNTAATDVTGSLDTWMDCLKDFGGFVDDPEAFLKHVNGDPSAPPTPAAH